MPSHAVVDHTVPHALDGRHHAHPLHPTRCRMPQLVLTRAVPLGLCRALLCPLRLANSSNDAKLLIRWAGADTDRPDTALVTEGASLHW
jgi:hypothetical protein